MTNSLSVGVAERRMIEWRWRSRPSHPIKSALFLMLMGLVIFGHSAAAASVAGAPTVGKLDQGKLIKIQQKALKSLDPRIQESINAAGSVGALVVFRHDATPPAVLPADEPLEATKQNIATVQKSAECIFVYRSDLALPAEAYACVVLARRVNLSDAQSTQLNAYGTQLSALQSELRAHDRSLTELREAGDQRKDDIAGLSAHQAAHDASLAELHEQIDAQKNETRTLRAHQEQQDETLAALRDQGVTLGSKIGELNQALKLANQRITTEAAALGPTMKLVSLHQQQLESLQQSVTNFEDGYHKVISAMDKNNQQLDTMVADLNTALAEVKQRLNEMKAKLDGNQ